jgi:hypothetical protein
MLLTHPGESKCYGTYVVFRRSVAFVAVVVLAAVLRFPDLEAGAGSGDEATVVDRAVLALDGRLAPPAFDWPPGSSYLLAAGLLAARLAGFDASADPDRLYTFARLLFWAVAVATVALTGLAGAALADGRARTWTGTGAALALAVSFVSVRLSRAAHPEHLQMLLVLLGLLAGLRFDRSRRTGWLVGAGVAAGLAGAVKYLGVTVAVVPLAAVLLHATTWPRRLAQATLLAATAVGGFAAGTLGTTLSLAFVRDFVAQWRHQAGGHLGYEAREPGWVFHLGTSLPGTWGWPLTVAAVAGLGLVAWRGTRAQRLAAGYTVVLFGLVGASRIAFPHYVLVVTPLLAAFAFVALGRLARWAPALAVLVVAASLVPTALDDVRLLRLDGAPRTTELAGALAAELDGPVWADHSTGVAEPARSAFSLAELADEVVGCDCYVALSSLQEDRYRRLPERYAAQVAGYEALRRAGRVVTVVEPSLPLSYRWDLLPQWGLGAIPLRGPLPTVGPTVTILDLRG